MGMFENIKKDSGYVIAGFVCLLGVFATASIKAEVITRQVVVLEDGQVRQLVTSTNKNTVEPNSNQENDRADSYEYYQPCG